ncbi:MAG: dipicolinate synthase subunit B [Clostridia bacterium]
MKSTLGFAITGSFCTFSKILVEMKNLIDEGYKIVPIFSYTVAKTDTRFFIASDFRQKVVEITQNEPIDTLTSAEPLGPKGIIDVMVVAPCTGNTLSKISLAITDTPVTMAVKAHLRNNKPVVIGLSSNDAMGLNLKNLGTLMQAKNVYFVPFGQDDFLKKPNSLISDLRLIGPTVEKALQGQQLQPVIIPNK